ncbi:MAG: MarR family winged helix-turn-helix transcriptional regulator [Mangrovibacterium sp.]
MKEFEPRTQLFSFVLRETIRSRKVLADKFSADGINLKVEQYVVLELIYAKVGITQQDIAETLQKDKTIVLRQVRGLIEEGLVVRRIDTIDGRKKNLMLTPKGRALYKKASASSMELSTDILKDLTEEEVEMMKKLCSTVSNYSK